MKKIFGDLQTDDQTHEAPGQWLCSPFWAWVCWLLFLGSHFPYLWSRNQMWPWVPLTCYKALWSGGWGVWILRLCIVIPNFWLFFFLNRCLELASFKAGFQWMVNGMMNGRKRKGSESQAHNLILSYWGLISRTQPMFFLLVTLTTLNLSTFHKPGPVLNVLCAFFCLIFEDES